MIKKLDKTITPASSDTLTYDKLFWLFMIGNVLGVLIEGVFCLIVKGHWESHVVSVLGHFNILYGSGAVLFFVGAAIMHNKNLAVKSLVFAVAATVLELLCGLILRFGLGMKAWDYNNRPLNFLGLICPAFTVGWGLAACAFCLLFPLFDRAISRLRGRLCHILCIAISAFMVVNISMTGVAIVRWSSRHRGIPPKTYMGELADTLAPDDYMQNRFIEWSFLDASAPDAESDA